MNLRGIGRQLNRYYNNVLDFEFNALVKVIVTIGLIVAAWLYVVELTKSYRCDMDNYNEYADYVDFIENIKLNNPGFCSGR